MSRYIFFGLLAATSALITVQATADPRPKGGNWGAHSSSLHGFNGKRMHAHGHRFGPGFGWPAYVLPESEYPVSVVPTDIGYDREHYRCEDIDCVYSYHPVGFYDPRPNGDKFAPAYVAPDAKIISVEGQKDR
jgi:hypothetical protein